MSFALLPKKKKQPIDDSITPPIEDDNLPNNVARSPMDERLPDGRTVDEAVAATQRTKPTLVLAPNGDQTDQNQNVISQDKGLIPPDQRYDAVMDAAGVNQQKTRPQLVLGANGEAPANPLNDAYQASVDEG